jgi:hypothetical protein
VKEGGVQLKLTIVDTPGFGEAVDNSSWSVYNYDCNYYAELCACFWMCYVHMP